jgi:anaerobic ribonucleoside-triphosphate reductase activating protein
MNLAGVIFPALNVYDGVAVEIYISGCYRNCPGCHNKEMQNFNYGQFLNINKLVQYLKEREEWFDVIAFLGGDILCQPNLVSGGLITILSRQFPKKKFWLFTGAELSEVPQWAKDYFNVIKCGKYIEELATNDFPTSSNQKLYYKGVDY